VSACAATSQQALGRTAPGHTPPTRRRLGRRNPTFSQRFVREIAQFSGSGLSLMPEGLRSAVTAEQMADLIAFLLLAP